MLLRPSNIPKIVILATKGTSANIIYNYLQDSCQIEAVIIEKPISKWKLLRSRAKKLGLTTVFGQILFQTLVQPMLFRLGIMRFDEVAFEGTELFLIGAIQVTLLFILFRPLEALAPAEHWDNRREANTDIFYTLLAKLGV